MLTCSDPQDSALDNPSVQLLSLALTAGAKQVYRLKDNSSESQGSRLHEGAAKRNPRRLQLQVCQFKPHLTAYQSLCLHRFQVYFTCPSNTPIYNMFKLLWCWKTANIWFPCLLEAGKAAAAILIRAGVGHSTWAQAAITWRKHLTAAIQ